MKNKTTLIKITVAILLFLCLLKMPYGFYVLVRFIVSVLFVIFAYKAYKEHEDIKMIIYGGLALLFQPFLKVALGREIWIIVDLIVGIVLIASCLPMFKSKCKK